MSVDPRCTSTGRLHLHAGACVQLMAALAMAYPGYVSTAALRTHLFSKRDHRSQQQQRLCMTASSLPMLEYVQRTWESAHGQYPVTLAVLELTCELINAGVNGEVVQVSTLS